MGVGWGVVCLAITVPVGGGGLGSRDGRKGWRKQEVNERMDPMVEEEEKKGGRREDTTRGRPPGANSEAELPFPQLRK